MLPSVPKTWLAPEQSALTMTCPHPEIDSVCTPGKLLTQAERNKQEKLHRGADRCYMFGIHEPVPLDGETADEMKVAIDARRQGNAMR